MNPYSTWMDGLDPLAVIRDTPQRLREAMARHGAAGTMDHQRAEGAWTGRQILAHLADTEIVFAMRLRQAVAEDNHVIQPFDQDAWAHRYAAADIESALAVFSAVRTWNVQFIEAQPEGIFAKELSHPERGVMTFRTLVETMAGHDRNHLSQLAAI
jgi:hypothetical protein